MKILHFIYGLSLGGAESFIRNCIEALADEYYEWHFAIQNSEVTNLYFAQNIPSNNIHILPLFTHNPIGQYRAFMRLLETERFDVVHIHANSLINPIPLICCLFSGQRFVIHSHSTSINHGIISNIIHAINRKWLSRIRSNTIKRAACSQDAGRWMFGKREFIVINNAIDIVHFTFNEISRTLIREKYGIAKDAFVLGTVGRMVEAKNYPFIISLFYQLKKIVPSSILLLVGDGPLKGNIEKQASILGNSVIFAGAQNDTAPYYSAMDCFLAPSYFEGLSIVTIEAQASGLDVVVSTSLPCEVNVSGEIQRLSLNETTEKWINAILLPTTSFNNRIQRGLKLQNCSYDLPFLHSNLLNIYKK